MSLTRYGRMHRQAIGSETEPYQLLSETICQTINLKFKALDHSPRCLTISPAKRTHEGHKPATGLWSHQIRKHLSKMLFGDYSTVHTNHQYSLRFMEFDSHDRFLGYEHSVVSGLWCGLCHSIIPKIQIYQTVTAARSGERLKFLQKCAQIRSPGHRYGTTVHKWIPVGLSNNTTRYGAISPLFHEHATSII